MLLLVFLKIGYATECTFSTFTPIPQGVIVIHAEDLRRDIHRFQTGLQHRYFLWISRNFQEQKSNYVLNPVGCQQTDGFSGAEYKLEWNIGIFPAS